MSDGFRQFFDTLRRDLDDTYLEAAATDLNNLTFRKGVLLSAQVADGGKGVGTMLRKPQPRDLSWSQAALSPGSQVTRCNCTRATTPERTRSPNCRTGVSA